MLFGLAALLEKGVFFLESVALSRKCFLDEVVSEQLSFGGITLEKDSRRARNFASSLGSNASI